MNSSPARVHQISVSDGGVPKLPVAEARITVEGVAGDRQRSTQIHGGPPRAVCLYSLEIIQALNKEGHSVKPGSCGENLTLSGLAFQISYTARASSLSAGRWIIGRIRRSPSGRDTSS